MSGVETTPAGQTSVDSHAEGVETGAVRPQNSLPMTNEREAWEQTLSRIKAAIEAEPDRGVLLHPDDARALLALRPALETGGGEPVPRSGDLHTAILTALSEALRTELPSAFHEEAESALCVPAPVGGYLHINVSQLAEVILPIIEPIRLAALAHPTPVRDRELAQILVGYRNMGPEGDFPAAVQHLCDLLEASPVREPEGNHRERIANILRTYRADACSIEGTISGILHTLAQPTPPSPVQDHAVVGEGEEGFSSYSAPVSGHSGSLVTDHNALLRRLCQALSDTPILMVDVRAARIAGEDEMVGYAKRVVEWSPKAKALIAEATASLSAQAGPTPRSAPQNPSVDAGLLEAARALIDCKDRVVLAMVECGGQEGEDHVAKRGADDFGDLMETLRSAIARAESSQGVDASLVKDLGAGTGSPTSRRGSHTFDAGEEFIEFKEALSDLRMLRKEYEDLNGGGPNWTARNMAAWAKIDELFAEEDEAAWSRQQEDAHG